MSQSQRTGGNVVALELPQEPPAKRQYARLRQPRADGLCIFMPDPNEPPIALARRAQALVDKGTPIREAALQLNIEEKPMVRMMRILRLASRTDLGEYDTLCARTALVAMNEKRRPLTLIYNDIDALFRTVWPAANRGTTRGGLITRTTPSTREPPPPKPVVTTGKIKRHRKYTPRRVGLGITMPDPHEQPEALARRALAIREQKGSFVAVSKLLGMDNRTVRWLVKIVLLAERQDLSPPDRKKADEALTALNARSKRLSAIYAEVEGICARVWGERSLGGSSYEDVARERYARFEHALGHLIESCRIAERFDMPQMSAAQAVNAVCELRKAHQSINVLEREIAKVHPGTAAPVANVKGRHKQDKGEK